VTEGEHHELLGHLLGGHGRFRASSESGRVAFQVIGRAPGAFTAPWTPDYATRRKRFSSSLRTERSVRLVWLWIWQTRLSETPRITPISASVRFLT
jgi:hypothetical protein